MAVKSILDVQVNDENFKAFVTLFNSYKAKLAEMPAEWAKANDEIKESQSAFAAVAAAMLVQNDMFAKLLKGQRDLSAGTDKSSKTWADIAKSTDRVAGNILNATTTLLRWASLGGAFSALLGAGSLWGIDKLAGNVGGQRRTAQGYGAKIGETDAFRLAYGRFIDPDALVGGVNQALTDPAKAYRLIGLGANKADIDSGDAVRVAASIIPKLKELADKTPTQFLANAIAQNQLDGVVSAEDLRRLKASSAGDIQQAGRDLPDFSRKLAVSDDDARAWQNLDIQLRLAGRQIETTFVNGLTPLTPQLTSLSASFADLVTAVLKAPAIKQGIIDLSAGLEDFSHRVGTEEFKQKVQGFVDNVSALTSAISFGAGHAGALAGGALTGAIAGFMLGGPAGARVGAWVGGALGIPLGKAEDEFDKHVADPLTQWRGGHYDDLGHWIPTNPADGSSVYKPNTTLALPPNLRGTGGLNFGDTSASPSGGAPGSVGKDTLNLFRQLENSGDSAVSPKGAIGRYQITPDTARTYHLDPSRLIEPAYNEEAAKTILADLMRRYGGDADAVAIGYNAGPGVANRWLRNGRDNSTLPAETQRYLDHEHRIRGGATVTIINATGGNAFITNSQLPQ